MKSKVNIFDTNERIQKSLITNSAYGLSSEFGLRIGQVFEDTVRKAKIYGLLAGQASSLYQMYNLKTKR